MLAKGSKPACFAVPLSDHGAPFEDFNKRRVNIPSPPKSSYGMTSFTPAVKGPGWLAFCKKEAGTSVLPLMLSATDCLA